MNKVMKARFARKAKIDKALAARRKTLASMTQPELDAFYEEQRKEAEANDEPMPNRIWFNIEARKFNRKLGKLLIQVDKARCAILAFLDNEKIPPVFTEEDGEHTPESLKVIAHILDTELGMIRSDRVPERTEDAYW